MFNKVVWNLIFLVGTLMSCSTPLSTKISEYTLSNGMHVILAPTKSHFSTVSLQYFVGGSFEDQNQLGLSHLLEHLMFKTSKHLKTGEFNDILEKELGGSFNAMTSYDSTIYYETVPSEHTFRVLDLEAERMQNLTLIPEEVAKEKLVVLEEMRNRIENSDIGFLFDRASSLFFRDFPYGRDLGGKENILSIPDNIIKAYYKAYYAPNNATLIVTGDIVDGLKDKIQSVFGTMPRINIPERHTLSDFDSIKTQTISIKRPVSINYAMILIKIPPALSSLSSGLNVIPYLLSNGNSSLLVKTLIQEKNLVSSISTMADISALPSCFAMIFTPYNAKDIPVIEKQIRTMMENLIHDPTLEQQLHKAHLSMATEYYNSLQDTAEFATSLAQSMAISHDPNFLIRLQTQEVSTQDTKDAIEWLLDKSWVTFTMLKN